MRNSAVKHHFPLQRTPLLLVIMGAIFITLSLSSCYTTKPYTYLQGSFDTASLSHIPTLDPVIRRGDVLGITVFSDDAAATAFYNQGSVGGGTTSMSSVMGTGTTGGVSASPTGGGGGGVGYTVDEKGNIEMQGLGLLHVEGLTRTALRDTLDGRLKNKLLLNPYYTIRFINYHFTILGEVGRPGSISIPGTQINLFEGLGLAGDMTFYANRNNILVIRDSLGKRIFGRMDITKPEVMNSPFFYLQQNDIVIVEQTKKKVAANDQTLLRNITITSSVVSVLVTLVILFRN